MNEHIGQEENLLIIKEIENNPAATQRTLSQKIGISLGKTNYLTAKGFEHKIELMHLEFLKPPLYLL